MIEVVEASVDDLVNRLRAANVEFAAIAAAMEEHNKYRGLAFAIRTVARLADGIASSMAPKGGRR